MSKNHADLLAVIGTRRVFVTGGSGFVGRNVIRFYRNAGAEVHALARSATAEQAIREAGGTPVNATLFDPALYLAMQGCDLLIHAAADTSHGGYSEEQWQVNVKGTEHVFAAARKAGIRRGVYISTESVLLTGKPLVMADESLPLPNKFAGAYSRSKAAGEKMALKQASDEFNVVVVRPRFVWGKGDTNALPQLVAAVTSGKFAWISGGGYLTSTTHIDNLCQGISRAAEYGTNGQVYFITDGAAQPFKEFVSALLATQGISVPNKSVPRPLIRLLAQLGDGLSRLTRGRVNGPLNMQSYATSAVEVSLDISKAKRELNYEPEVSIRQGMEMMR